MPRNGIHARRPDVYAVGSIPIIRTIPCIGIQAMSGRRWSSFRSSVNAFSRTAASRRAESISLFGTNGAPFAVSS